MPQLTTGVPNLSVLLAYRPFLDPLPVGGGPTWTLGLFLPLVLLIAFAYKTIKLNYLPDVPKQALRLALQISVFMAGAALLLSLITRWL